MKLCIPTADPDGLDSKISGHFGSAPWFMLVETPSRTWKAIRNGNDHHDHGHCNPITMFSDERPDAIVCLNIGAGAITRLGDMGVGVFKASARSVEEAVDLFEKGECVTLTEQDGCTAHR